MKTNIANRCPICGKGNLQAQRIEYSVPTADGNKVVVPNLLVEICDHCSETIIPADAVAIIEAAISEQTEQLTPRELERIREDLDVDQTEMSEILGLGGKTYHRWEKGNQIPSRSMGYYLRILWDNPEVFTWLRERGWRKKNRVAALPVNFDFAKAFPDLPSGADRRFVRTAPCSNPAKALFGRSK